MLEQEPGRPVCLLSKLSETMTKDQNRVICLAHTETKP